MPGLYQAVEAELQRMKAEVEPPEGLQASNAIMKDVEGARARAYSHGAWDCPKCKDGWQIYMINTDMNICWRCGYKGGPV